MNPLTIMNQSLKDFYLQKNIYLFEESLEGDLKDFHWIDNPRVGFKKVLVKIIDISFIQTFNFEDGFDKICLYIRPIENLTSVVFLITINIHDFGKDILIVE